MVHMGLAHMGPESPEVELQHARVRVIPLNKSFINLVQKLNFALKVFYSNLGLCMTLYVG